jgi:hypothetical protein
MKETMPGMVAYCQSSNSSKKPRKDVTLLLLRSKASDFPLKSTSSSAAASFDYLKAPISQFTLS